MERLDAYLGFPKSDPHGDPIPDTKGKFRILKSKPLSETDPGKRVRMTGVIDHSPAFLQFLDQHRIALGQEFKIETRTSYDSSLLVKVNKKTNVHLSHQVAKNILVSDLH